jgi:hypothetical protein
LHKRKYMTYVLYSMFVYLSSLSCSNGGWFIHLLHSLFFSWDRGTTLRTLVVPRLVTTKNIKYLRLTQPTRQETDFWLFFLVFLLCWWMVWSLYCCCRVCRFFFHPYPYSVDSIVVMDFDCFRAIQLLQHGRALTTRWRCCNTCRECCSNTKGVVATQKVL